MIGRLAAIAALIVTTLGSAQANEARIAVSVVTATDAGVHARDTAARLRAELSSLDYDVRGHGGGELAATFTVAEQRGEPVIDVRLRDEPNVVHRIEAGAGRDGHHASVLAARAVEYVRASLTRFAEARRRAEPPSSDATAAAPALNPHLLESLTLAAGPALLASVPSGELAAALALRVGIGHERFAADVALLGPATRPSLRAPGGSASLRQEAAALHLLYDFAAPASRISAAAQAGAGLYHLQARGAASAPYTAVTDDVYAAWFDAGALLAFRLSASVALGLDARLAWLAPTVRLRIADSSEAIGGPLAVTSALLVLRR
jgi:hypothetical protein